MRWQILLATWLASAAPAWAATGGCFLTADWGHIAPGQPVILAWDGSYGGFWDILLNTDVRTRASLVGSIARNITQSSVVWLPPDDISSDPDKLFAVQLWDLSRGTSCNSPSFTIKSTDKPPQALPPGPLVTTSATLANGAIKVTATVASFTTSLEPSYSSAIPTTTNTGAPMPTKTSKPATNVTAIMVGIVFGTLVAVLLVLSMLLWRAKRKRTQSRGTLLLDDTKTDRDLHSPLPPDTAIELESSSPRTAERPGDGQAHKMAEMQGDEQPRFEMSGLGKPLEMPADPMPAPVELPAELPEGFTLTAPMRRHSLISTMTSDSRRSSLVRFPVSPATLTARRTSISKN